MSLVFLSIFSCWPFWNLGPEGGLHIALWPAFPRGAPSMMALLGLEVSGSFPHLTSPFPFSPGAQDARVRMPPEVWGRLGDTVELPCHLLTQGPEGNVSQVTWQRLDPPKESQSVAAYHPSHGLSFPSPQFGKERLSFLAMGQSTGPNRGRGIEMRDATLVLQGLTVEDEGNYSCEFATFPQGTSRGVTWLRATGEPRWDGREVGGAQWESPFAGLFLSLLSPWSSVSWQIFIKHLLFARCCSASWGYSRQQGVQQIY